MLTHAGSFEAGSGRYEVLAAQSFTDLSPTINPEPLIQKQPELFVSEWDGPTEVVAIVDEAVDAGRVAAAGVLRYCLPNPSTLEVYAVGEVGTPDLDPEVLKQALRERVEERRAAMQVNKNGKKQPVRTTVHWGSEPPALDVSPDNPGLGVKAYRKVREERTEESRQKFMEDLQQPYGPLKF